MNCGRWRDAARRPPASTRPPTAPRARLSAGRGSLVQQAVEILLAAPELAVKVSDSQRDSLAALGQSGSDFLCELLDEPARAAGAERRPGHRALPRPPLCEHLESLAGREMLISDKPRAREPARRVSSSGLIAERTAPAALRIADP